MHQAGWYVTAGFVALTLMITGSPGDVARDETLERGKTQRMSIP